MSNKKRINDRMVKLKKHSSKIEKNRKDILVKVLIKLGMQSAEFSQALIKLSNAFQNSSRKVVEKIHRIYESGGEMITAADGSIKKNVIVGKNYESLEPERVKVDWAERPRKIGIVSGGTYGASGVEKIKLGSEIFVVRKDSLPELSRSFTETTLITPKMLEGVMAMTKNKNGNSESVFYGSREWKGKKPFFR